MTADRSKATVKAQPDETVEFVGDAVADLAVGRTLLLRRIYLTGPGVNVRLAGMSKADAIALVRALRLVPFGSPIGEAVDWHHRLTGLLQAGAEASRWISTEAVDAVAAHGPDRNLLQQIREAGSEAALDEDERAAVTLLAGGLDEIVAGINETITVAELDKRRKFLDTIERTPLTDEQARAVVCFDNRVQLLAAAGSGKTSVMVARAAYAVHREFVSPDRILLLAFNKAAAAELGERVAARFEAAGIDHADVKASTFHSFGLDVIGAVTGKRPRVPAWVADGEDIRTVAEIADHLRDISEDFRYRWDLYRTLFAGTPLDLDAEGPHDAWDPESKDTGYRTYGGEVVKSYGERLIANFLYLNGVSYEYERRYVADTATATHSAYHPDFYYPDIDAWHEHWATDRDGTPATFAGYTDSTEWKRATHADHGTALIETTTHNVVWGNGLAELGAELERRGQKLDWNPDRPPQTNWAKPVKHEDLARLLREFMRHVKSNGWTPADLEDRLTADVPHLDGFRTREFLAIFWAVYDEWQRRLAENDNVDYEDMLIRAAELLESGEYEAPYDLLLVDEFQDASRARARLARGVVSRPGRFLLAVGDDWQSINRFAGADIGVMTEFEKWFGRGPQLALTATFRCPQTICDAASTFVMKNPTQFTKKMRSVQPEPGTQVKVIRSDDPASALAGHLRAVSDSITGTATVQVLGRYRFDRDVMPPRMPGNLDVEFRTVHSAKGLEADFVVVVGMKTGTYGFPSSVASDPVLAVAQPLPELFPNAEERRLLYVALTRARRQVTLIAPVLAMSPFVIELADDRNVTVEGGDGRPLEICHVCHAAAMKVKHGRYGEFLSCTRWPACNGSRSLS